MASYQVKQKMKTRNGQHLHTTAQKSESLPISLSTQTQTLLSKAQTQYSKPTNPRTQKK